MASYEAKNSVNSTDYNYMNSADMNRMVSGAALAPNPAPSSAFAAPANASSAQKARVRYDYMDVSDEWSEPQREPTAENSDSDFDTSDLNFSMSTIEEQSSPEQRVTAVVEQESSFKPILQDLHGLVGSLESGASSNAVPVPIPTLPKWSSKPPIVAVKPQPLLPSAGRPLLVLPKPPSSPFPQSPSTPPTPGAHKYSPLQGAGVEVAGGSGTSGGDGNERGIWEFTCANHSERPIANPSAHLHLCTRCWQFFCNECSLAGLHKDHEHVKFTLSRAKVSFIDTIYSIQVQFTCVAVTRTYAQLYEWYDVTVQWYCIFYNVRVFTQLAQT